MSNKEIKKDKASVLAVTMIILGLILSIGLSASLVSILGNKASVGSNKSNLAYSRANTGVEDLLAKIKDASSSDTIASIDTDGTCDGIVNGTNFKVELKALDGTLITDCGVDVSEIRTIKSTGMTDGNYRTIEMAVAQETYGCRYVGATSGTYRGGEVGGYDGGNEKCEDAFPSEEGMRMCMAVDFVNGLPDDSGWYSTSAKSNDSPTFVSADDCAGWSISTGAYGCVFCHTGNMWNGGPNSAFCGEKKKILCCKCE